MSKNITPPHDLELERSIIGAMLIDSSCIDMAVMCNIAGKAFYNSKLGFLCDRLIYIHIEKKETTDLVNVINDIKLQGKSDSITDIEIIELQTAIATTAGFKNWCAILLKHHASRMVMSACHKAISSCLEYEKPILENIKDLKIAITEAESVANVKQHKTTTDLLKDSIDGITRAQETGENNVVPYYLSGVTSLLKHGRGQLHVLAAPCGIGKTSFMLSVLLKQIEKGVKHVLFCAETPEQTIMDRMIAIEADIESEKLMERGALNQGEIIRLKKAVEKIKRYSGNFWIRAKGTYRHSPDGIRIELKKIIDQTKEKIDFITIDHLQNMQADGTLAKSGRVEQLENFMIDINQNIIGEFGVAGTLLSQLNRDKDRDRNSKSILISDLKGSSSIEQEADYITCLNRNTTVTGVSVEVDWYSLKIRGSRRVNTVLEFNTTNGKFYGVKEASPYGKYNVRSDD